VSSEHWIVGDPGPGPRRILALITPTPVLVPRAVTQVCSGVSLGDVSCIHLRLAYVNRLNY